jgi:hypothetical protein
LRPSEGIRHILANSQGFPFLLDELQVMGQMLDRTVHHLGNSAIAAIPDDTDSLPYLGRP